MVKSEKPDQIDYQASTDEQKQAYWAKVDECKYNIQIS